VADFKVKNKSSLFKVGTRVHLVGIGGSGLSAIARVLMEMGCRVSGSDRAASALTAALADEGATVYVGHRAEQVTGADVLVVSSAIPAHNVELQAARAQGITVLKRADFLGEMMAGRGSTEPSSRAQAEGLAEVVAVAGAHGKTTTSGMIASVLLAAGYDPTFIVGGQIAHLGTNARAGQGPFVIEADEYDHTFLGLRPTIAVVTNVEHDHPDCYPTFDEFRAAFEAFADLLPPDGKLIVCGDEPGARALGQRASDQGKSVLRYGLSKGSDWQATNAQANGAGGCDYVALARGELKGLVRLRMPGTHNVLNSLAVLAVADVLGVPFEATTQALRGFRGIGRRFEIKGVANGVTVVDDYAHHPTEIRATLAAARENYPGHRIWAMWQPHTFSRVRALLDDFVTAFADADHVIVAPIYAAREKDDLGMSSAGVAARMEHADVRLAASLDEALAFLESGVRSGDVVLTLGAGDGDTVGERLLVRLGIGD
jgi:UDP-N-acetylmuramate--alanine ligase